MYALYLYSSGNLIPDADDWIFIKFNNIDINMCSKIHFLLCLLIFSSETSTFRQYNDFSK